MSKRAIISGIYGQDGLLLTEHLLKLNYKIFGIVNNLKQGFPELSGVQIIKADISNSIDMKKVFELVNPDEFYHLAANHHSSEFNSKELVWSDMLRINFLATQNILDTLLEITPTCRFLFAGSSQMYTATTHPTIIDELTPFKPSTYYGFTKVASAHLINFYRERKGLWGLTLILFNHQIKVTS
jgi:GDPmannose 4,6-dehydratase